MDPGSHVEFQHQKHQSGRGPSNEHFWQVSFKSVQWFQRRRFKCEKLTDGRRRRRRTPSHDKRVRCWEGSDTLYLSCNWVIFCHNKRVKINGCFIMTVS